MSYIHDYIGDERGAVTVDWVVLTAFAVSITVATMAVVTFGAGSMVDDVVGAIDGGLIQTGFSGD